MYQRSHCLKGGPLPPPPPPSPECIGPEINPSTCVIAVDPVPDLVDGAGREITTDTNVLATGGVPAAGVAADFSSRLLLRIHATFAGERFNVNIQDDGASNPNNIAFSSGFLSPVNGGLQTLQMQVRATQTSSGVFAFLQYFPPSDFSRNPQDDVAPSRTVQISVQSRDTMFNQSLPITIMRPPVFLIHGLWSHPDAWNSFKPLISDSLRRFYVERANYGDISFKPTNMIPSYPYTSTLKRGALGFASNAQIVFPRMIGELGEFRAQYHVAATELDVVVHSMGGDIARTIALFPNYTPTSSFRNGLIHKLITIGTPHLGSPLATQLLDDRNACVRDLLALGGSVSINTATVDGVTVSGGVGDLSGDNAANPQYLSPALQRIQQVNPNEPWTYTISAQYEGEIQQFPPNKGTAIRGCGLFYNSPLGQLLSTNGWPTIFGGRPSDGVVSVYSQTAGNVGKSNIPATFVGAIHAPDLSALGFPGYGELQSVPDVLDDIPSMVVAALNAPTTPDYGFFKLTSGN